jgi:hypothetical protein
MDRGIPWIDFTNRKGRLGQSAFLLKQTASNGKKLLLFYVFKNKADFKSPRSSFLRVGGHFLGKSPLFLTAHLALLFGICLFWWGGGGGAGAASFCVLSIKKPQAPRFLHKKIKN